MDWHAQSSADVIKTLKTNEKNGLSSAEAKKRLEKYVIIHYNSIIC